MVRRATPLRYDRNSEKWELKTFMQLLDNLLESSTSRCLVAISSNIPAAHRGFKLCGAAHRNPATLPQPVKVEVYMQGTPPWALGLLLNALAVLEMCIQAQWCEMLLWHPCC